MRLPIKAVAATVIGVALGVIGASLIPIVDLPFSGCDGSRWLTLQSGCSHWLEFMRGLLFVMPIAVLAPVRWMLPVAAVVVLFVLALFGGIEGVQTGLHLRVETITDIYNLLLQAYPSVLGGLLVLLVWLAVVLTHNSGSAPNKGFNRTPVSSGPAKPGEFGGGAG